MPDFPDFFPLFSRSEDDLRADYDTRANAGLTPDDPDWVDTRQGSQFQLNTQPSVIENALVYDKLNEILAAAFLVTSWGEYLDLHAASYGEERLAATTATGIVTFTGDEGTIIGSGVRVSPPQTDPEVDPPVFETTGSGVVPVGGTLDLPVRALEAGVEGNVAAGTVTLPQTGVSGVLSVTNVDPFSGGSDVEGDDQLKKRLIMLFSGKGSATAADYAREALRRPGVGYVTVTVHWAGPGTVRLSVRDDEGNPVSPVLVDELQTYFDPVPGEGKGWAPINHEVTVVTPDPVIVNVHATLEYDEGYAAGDLDEQITNRVNEYILSLEPGDAVVYRHVMAQFFKVEGVLDVTALEIGTDGPPPTGTVDVAITADELARPGTVTLD